MRRIRPKARLALEALPLPAGSVPDGLGFDRDGRLLVCDNGPRQQVHVFDIKQVDRPSSSSLSAKRGACSPAPSPARPGPGGSPDRPARVVTLAGNFYVSCNVPRGGTVLRAFSPKRELLWELLGLEFVDVADADPASEGRDLFTADDRYSFDPDAPAGKELAVGGPHARPIPLPARPAEAVPGLQCGTVAADAGRQTVSLPARDVAGYSRDLSDRGRSRRARRSCFRADRSRADVGVVATRPARERPLALARRQRRWPDGIRRVCRRPTAPKANTGRAMSTPPATSGRAAASHGIWRWRFQGLDEHGNPRYDPKPKHFDDASAIHRPSADRIRPRDRHNVPLGPDERPADLARRVGHRRDRRSFAMTTGARRPSPATASTCPTQPTSSSSSRSPTPASWRSPSIARAPRSSSTT